MKEYTEKSYYSYNNKDKQVLVSVKICFYNLLEINYYFPYNKKQYHEIKYYIINNDIVTK